MQEFDDQLWAAVQRFQWLEDLNGYLRRDILIAQGVTFPEQSGPPKPPDPEAPTFEKVVGRKPTSFLMRAYQHLGMNPYAAEVDPTQSELEHEETAARLLNTQRALAEAQMKAQMARTGRPAP